MKVKVTSVSFSKNPLLVAELRRRFPEAVVNEAGTRFSKQALIDYLQGADAAIIGTERIDAEVLEALPELRVIAKYGVGLDNIDESALDAAQVRLAWKGGVNRRSVSEMALGFLLGLFRNLFFTSRMLSSGTWHKEGGCLLSERTIGIIGCGFIGSDLVRLLLPLGCRVLVHDILDKSDFVEEQAALGQSIEAVSLDRLLAESDAVSLHVPLTEETRHLVDEGFLSSMKADAFLINTSRGPVVDESALKAALQQNRIAGAAIDVYASEPPEDLELLSLPNLVATPHIGGNAAEAVLAMGRAAIEGLLAAERLIARPVARTA